MTAQTQQQNIAAAFERLVSATNTLNGFIGSLSSLSTTAKSNLVTALNELYADIQAIPALTTLINDAQATGVTTWSSNQIQAQITNAIAQLVSGAPIGEQTLAALASEIHALAAQEGLTVSFGGVQTLTDPQKIQACQNIGIGDPTYDYVNAPTVGINATLAVGL